MVAELEAHVDDINYEVAIEREKLVRHDVMSHVYAYGQQCPKAAGIIHLGATSCYVGDNTDIIVMRQGLRAGAQKAHRRAGKAGAVSPRNTRTCPAMAYTHCQPAQPTTVGKRATLWANELVMDLRGDRPPSGYSAAARRQGYHRHPGYPSWSCSRAMPTRSAPWTLPSPRRWALTPRLSSRCPARPTAARWTPSSSTHWPASARAA